MILSIRLNVPQDKRNGDNVSFEKLPYWNDLKEEQRTALLALRKVAAKNGVLIGFKTNGLFFLSFCATILINGLYVGNSAQFAFFATVINGIFIIRYLMSSLKKESDRLKKEVNKILKP